MYRERASRLAGAAVWSRAVPAEPAPYRVLPDGCLDLIWHDGRLLVAGPDTEARVFTSPAGSSYVAVRFPPGVGPAVLGVPADLLRDRRVPLADVWPAAVARWATDRVTDADRRGAALEELALARLAECPPDPLMLDVAQRLRAGAPVSAVAVEVGLSERQLRRRSLAAFGYGPKTLARILRLQWALSRAGSVPAAAVAADAGYADQAHLSREVRALAGVPLGVLTASPRFARQRRSL